MQKPFLDLRVGVLVDRSPALVNHVVAEGDVRAVLFWRLSCPLDHVGQKMPLNLLDQLAKRPFLPLAQ